MLPLAPTDVSTASFPINAQKSPRPIKLQYFCQMGSRIVLTSDDDSTSPALSLDDDKQPSGPFVSVTTNWEYSAASWKATRMLLP